MTPEINSHLTANAKMKRKDIMVNNFLGGLAWGIGTVVGAGVIVGIAGYILNKSGILNLLGMIFGQPTF